jgi:hypothetical protein
MRLHQIRQPTLAPTTTWVRHEVKKKKTRYKKWISYFYYFRLRKLLLEKRFHSGDILGLKCFTKYKAVIMHRTELDVCCLQSISVSLFSESIDCCISLLQREVHLTNEIKCNSFLSSTRLMQKIRNRVSGKTELHSKTYFQSFDLSSRDAFCFAARLTGTLFRIWPGNKTFIWTSVKSWSSTQNRRYGAKPKPVSQDSYLEVSRSMFSCHRNSQLGVQVLIPDSGRHSLNDEFPPSVRAELLCLFFSLSDLMWAWVRF